MDQLPHIPPKQGAPGPELASSSPSSGKNRTKGSLPALLVSSAAFLLVVVFLLYRGPQAMLRSDDPELSLLRAEVQEKRLALGLTSNANSASQSSALALTERILGDTEALQGVLRAQYAQLQEKESLLQVKITELEQAARARQALTSEISTLSQQLEKAQQESLQQAGLQSQLADARLLLDTANQELSRLREQLKNAPSSSSLQATLDQLAIANQDLLKLQSQLENAVSAQEFSALQEENRNLNQQLQSLRAELNRKRLFAEDLKQLSPRALQLHARLSQLEGLTNQERLTQYREIKAELGAEVVETVAFETGSASLEAEKVHVILESLQRTQNNSEYLIVGYASQTGDLEVNRGLSSKRATTVASLVDQTRGSQQAIKAVYLGQTDRFSQTNEYANQVCEIWEIAP